MIHFSLFSGIGGFELAAEWMGWKNYVSCEINDFCNKIRNYYWPDCFHHDDVKTLTMQLINKKLCERYGKDWRNDDIILTGGFPCQPYSSAGKRLGKADERHLFPEMLRVISEIKPTYIVGENVYGLVNWNGGVVFEEVCADLEAIGYEVQPVLLPASGIDAPHHRMRVWFIAHAISIGDGKQQISYKESIRKEFIYKSQISNVTNANCNGLNQCNGNNEVNASEGRINALGNAEQSNVNGNAAHSDGIGLPRESNWTGKSRFINEAGKIGNWHNFPTQSPICGGDDGLPTELDGITFSNWRKKSIMGYGNAIVPQLAYILFQTIVKTKQNEQKSTGNGQHSGMD
jgi:DNA (cytosine-5)-methyltransferase 1